MTDYTIHYPRRRLVRTFMRIVGRLLTRILARPQLMGMENFPKQGPVILVGNHVAMLEAAMMVIYPPYYVELLATGEIPLDPRYGWVVHMFGMIPIKRGAMDRKALDAALDVLKQGGVVGIFPEGGIWSSSGKQNKTGVSWLSSMSGAPLVPIGFGGIDGAMAKAFSFKRPRLTMNVGPAIPAINTRGEEKNRKQILEDAATYIMQRVDDLIPEEDKRRYQRVYDERFELKLDIQRADGSAADLPAELHLQRPEMLAKFFHRPLLLDVLSRNLKLPVQALQRIDTETDPQQIAAATEIALHYLETDNPHFLTYRFGYDEGGAMQEGLRGLRAIAHWARQQKLQLRIQAIRRFKQRGHEGELVEDRPGALPAI